MGDSRRKAPPRPRNDPSTGAPLLLLPMFLNMGAFLSMSGRIMKRTLLPRMNTLSSCELRHYRWG